MTEKKKRVGKNAVTIQKLIGYHERQLQTDLIGLSERTNNALRGLGDETTLPDAIMCVQMTRGRIEGLKQAYEALTDTRPVVDVELEDDSG